MSFTVVIPARMASVRLPGKPLLDIAGKSLLQRVYEQASQSKADRVIVATDDQLIFNACEEFGAQVQMTASHHKSGTERIAEVVQNLALDPEHIVVNVQGDEPMLPPSLIDMTASTLANSSQAQMSTLRYPIHQASELFNPNIVKVVTDNKGNALYFSRAPIPWDRDQFEKHKLQQHPELEIAQTLYFRHIGIYAYRARFISQYIETPTSTLEASEKLEQLRALENGYRIAVALAPQDPGMGVDTAEELEAVRRHFNH